MPYSYITGPICAPNNGSVAFEVRTNNTANLFLFDKITDYYGGQIPLDNYMYLTPDQAFQLLNGTFSASSVKQYPDITQTGMELYNGSCTYLGFLFKDPINITIKSRIQDSEVTIRSAKTSLYSISSFKYLYGQIGLLLLPQKPN